MSIGNRTPNFENSVNVWRRRKEKIKHRTDRPEFPFGLKELDEISHGVTRGKVTVIAARTSVGKSAFALQSAFNMADQGKTIVYISLEDDSEQIAERLFSNLREVDNRLLLTGKVDHNILDDPAIDEMFKRVKLLTMTDFGYNFDEIKTIIDSLDPKPEIVFLDYVQMVEQLPRESEYEALSRFAQQCKKFAEINDVGLVIISQINRSGAKEGRPSPHHLQGCGKLEQVCDLLLILYKPFATSDSSYDYDGAKGMEECPEDYIEVTVAKNKNGVSGWVVPLQFEGKYFKFSPWIPEPKYEIPYGGK